MFESREFVEFARRWLPPLEAHMRKTLQAPHSSTAQFYGMMDYHMGWRDESLRPGDFAVGKRVRPLLCLMACEAVGGDPAQALPAASAVEILHNFSLVHDDIEDGDEMRRHRPTVWKVWGVPQAINAGDGMFALAYQAMLELADQGVPADAVLGALQEFTRTCLHLTEGQYLDLVFERRTDVTVDDYVQMIGGKTAALLAASLAIGAQVGGANAHTGAALHRFGFNLGLAFQIQDDILGIWGDPLVTGKAAGNDLLRQKKSLPVLFALHHKQVGPQLQRLWNYTIGSKQIPGVLTLLDQAGARAYAQTRMEAFHRQAILSLEEALGNRAASSPLLALADGLAERQA